MLRPHLHLLVPSSSEGLLLEARIYLPFRKSLPGSSSVPLTGYTLSTQVSSTPVRYDEIGSEALDELKALGIDCLITAAHPWQKLGGNMLDPVLSQHLTSAISEREERYAVVTFNSRGVGRSQGSMGVLGLYAVPGEKDFAAVEAYAVSLLRPTQVRRAGYSWGSVAAINAARDVHIHSTLLISPPTTLFALTTLFASRTFSKGVKEAGKVMIVHGTKDQFTSTSAYEALATRGEVRCWVVNGADHFYRDRESEKGLIEGICTWLDT